MKESGIESFVEVGPEKVLQGLNKRIDRKMLSQGVESLEQVKHFKQAGIQYRKRPYGLPLLTATGCLVGYFILMFALTTAGWESRYREKALAQIEEEWLEDLDRAESWEDQVFPTRSAARRIGNLDARRMPKNYREAVFELRDIMEAMALALEEEDELRFEELEASRQAKYQQLYQLSYDW